MSSGSEFILSDFSLRLMSKKAFVPIRSSQALHYLRDTDFSLAEIADKLGFSEASAFTRAMRHRFDMAPRDMRRYLREGKVFLHDAN